MANYHKKPATNDFKGDKENSLLSLGIHHKNMWRYENRDTNFMQFYLKSLNDHSHLDLKKPERLIKEIKHSSTVILRKINSQYSDNRMTSIMIWDNKKVRDDNNWYCKFLFKPGNKPITKLFNVYLQNDPDFLGIKSLLEEAMNEWEKIFYQQGYIQRF